MILPTTIPPALNAMAAYPQWICWQLIQRPGKPKPDKVPTDPTTRLPMDAQNPANWMTAETASATAKEKGLGVGFVFTEQDPFFFLDIDSCATPQGTWSGLANSLTSQLPRAAVETSISRAGLHVFGRCPRGLIHSNRNPLGIELYTSGRFVAIGFGAAGDANTECPGIAAIAAQYFPPAADLTGVWTTEAQVGFGIEDDDKLIEKACASRSVRSTFGDKASFEDLFTANDLALSATYPDPARAFDESAADMALAAHLAFWTGGNCDQIERIMLRSALARAKWEARPEWLRDTICKAVAGGGDMYKNVAAREQQLLDEARAAAASAPTPAPPPPTSTPTPPPPPPPPPPAANDTPTPVEVPHATEPSTAAPVGVSEITAIEGLPYVPPNTVREMFKDYIYVLGVNRVMTPKGVLINEAQFKTLFGHHQFALDHYDHNTTTNAWKAYAHSHAWTFRRADRLCFKPMNYNLTIKDGNDIAANTWRDPMPLRKKGDPGRFVRHVRHMLPNGDDAERLLAYMAACVQHQGTKFAWCPLIQGVQGNGKSMIAEALTHAIGEKYTHVMKGVSVNSQFNGWIQDRTLIVVEDLHMGGSEAAMETIKPLITARRISVERKGFDQETEDVCCNFIMTTNHQDALPLDPNERRWAMFFCAQQSKEDMVAQGLIGSYFEELWNWLRAEGFAVVAEYLWTYVIPAAMNPATSSVTAPETTMHEQALVASRSAEAQHLADAISGGDQGFMDGWVSSLRASTVLAEKRCAVAPRKLAAVLERLGYVKHPGVKAGRASRRVAHESGRPFLWVTRGHSSLDLGGLAVVEAYERAQGYPAGKVVPMRPPS